MNRIFRAVWNQNTQSWVAASEVAKGRTKSSRSVKKPLFVTGVLLGVLGTAFSLPAAAAAFTDVVESGTVTGQVVDGLQTIKTSGVANNTTVIDGGTQVVSTGGITNDTVLAEGSQSVNTGGTSYGTTINSGSMQFVTGGHAYGTIVHDGGNEFVYTGGTSHNTVINAGGSSTVENDGVANGTIIYAGGEQFVNGGIANGTIIDGGVQDLFGTADDTVIRNGGRQNVYNGGEANNTTINAGGAQEVLNGGVSNSTYIDGVGAGQTVSDGGQSYGTVVVNGGFETLTINGTSDGSTIGHGGTQVVIGGQANSTTVNANGYQEIHAGTANGTIVNVGGEQYIDVGGSVNDTVINGGYQLLYGTANNTTAHAGEIYTGSGSVLTGLTQINGTATIGGALITNNGTLSFNTGSSNTVDTDITGSGSLDKTGSGTLILNNTNTYTGGTSVSGGRLIIGGSAADNTASISGAVDVLNGGTLGGHGQVAGSVTVQSGGKVNPGNSIGTLTVGDAHFMSGSTFEARVKPDGNDKLVASSGLGTGTVQIDSGSKLAITAGAGMWNDTTIYTLIDTDSGVTGTFTDVSSNLAFLDADVDYSNSNQVNLVMKRNSTSFGSVGNTDNERGTGDGIESLNPSNPIAQEILGMSKEQANSAYNNLSGEIHGSVKSALLENSRYSRHAVLEHLDRTVAQSMPETGHNLWVNTWAHDGHLKADSNAARLDNKGAGLMIGSDLYQNGVTTIGAAVGYEQSDLKAGGVRNSDADAKAIHLMGYGKTQVGAVDVKAGIGYSQVRVDTKRHVNVSSIESQNNAKYNAGLVQLFAEGSRTFDINEQARVTPYAGLLYQRVNTNGFTEKGTAAQLQGSSSNDDAFSTTVGVRGQWDINAKSKLYANLGWQHTFGDRAPEATLNFMGGSSYKVKGVEINRDSALVGLGADIELKPNMSLNVGYDGKFGNRSVDHGIKVGLEFKF